jgi:hypothetical protein
MSTGRDRTLSIDRQLHRRQRQPIRALSVVDDGCTIRLSSVSGCLPNEQAKNTSLGRLSRTTPAVTTVPIELAIRSAPGALR